MQGFYYFKKTLFLQESIGMKTILNFVITSLLILLLANYLPGISVDSWKTSLIVAIVLALLNTFVKPIIIFFTIPFTIFTLGLFLLVINASMVILASKLIDGFNVSGILNALIFSIILSAVKSIIERIIIKSES